MNTFKARNRILSFALALCLLSGMTLYLPGPVEVRAALPQQGDTAVGQPYDGIDFEALGGGGIYYGTYDHITELDYDNPSLNMHEGTATPVLWRVMGEEDNSTHLTLLSEYILEAAQFDSGNHVYRTSNMVNILSTMSGAIFQGKEPDYTEPVAVTTRMLDYWGGYDVFSYSGTTYPDVTTGQILYLMWGTAGNNRNVYWETGATGNTAYRLPSAGATPKGGTQEKPYWLRSPIPDHAFTTMGILYTFSEVGPTTNVTETLGIRPAFQLNPSSLIFASEILDDVIGKPWATQADGVDYVAAAGGDTPNFKLTIVDSGLTAGTAEANGQNMASFPTITVEPDDLVAVTASGATSGTQLTYKIVDRAGGGIVGYGQGADNANLTVSAVNLDGDNLKPGKYTVYVWTQRNNGNYSHEGSRPMWFKLDVISNDATLASVAGETITPASGTGTDTLPYTDSISLGYSVDNIEVGHIDPTDANATVNLYTDAGFTQDEDQPIPLAPGDPTRLYIKVTAENGTTELYYNITATRDSALALSGGSLPDGVVGTAYTYDLSNDVARGTAPYNFALDGVTSLPDGLNLVNGEIIGSPVNPANNHPFTVEVTDSGSPQQTDTASYAITIKGSIDPQGPDVSPSSLNITTGDKETVTISLGESGNMAAQADVSSNKPDIASVDPDSRTDNGDMEVTGELEGTAIITVIFSGGDLTGTVEKTVAVTVSDGAPDPIEPDNPDPTPDPQPVGNHGSTGRGSSYSSDGSSSPGGQVAKTQLPASAFSWDGDRTLTVNHDSISTLGLLSVQWDGQTLTRGSDYTVHQGSVIVRFDEDFMAAQSSGNHTVQVEFLGNWGETTITVDDTGLATGIDDLFDNDTHNPNTGGYPDGNMGATGNPSTRGSRDIGPILLLGSLGAAALYRVQLKES